jgi:dienelactone hydrolase
VVVLTPELVDLADYRVTSASVSVIRDSVLYLQEHMTSGREHSIGLIGVSFAGGLALVAASEPPLADALSFVTSLGGHHDLARVLRFFVRQQIESPEGRQRATAHEYGLAILVYEHVDRFVPVADRALVRDAFRHWLREDRPTALARIARRSTPEAERLFALLTTGRLRTLGPELERIIHEREAALLALSPRGRMSSVKAPIYLLHGETDDVIPAAEARWAELELSSVEHAVLVSPVLRHVDRADAPKLGDQMKLVHFVSRLL